MNPVRPKLIYVDKWVRLGLSVVKATPNWRICTENKGFCNALINMSCGYGLWAEWLHSHYTIELLHRWFIVMVLRKRAVLLCFSFLLELNTSFSSLGSFTPINCQSGSMILDRLVRWDQTNILWFINETMVYFKQFIWRNVVWKRIAELF